MRPIFKKILPLLLCAVLLASCAPTVARPTLKPPPTAVRGTQAPGSLSLGSVSLTSSGTSPDYTIQTTIPVLQGVYPHRDDFNLRVSALVQQHTDIFKKT